MSRFDLDRELASLLESEGPIRVPTSVVDAGLAIAASTPQRRPFIAALDTRSWPATGRTVANPAFLRVALLLIIAMLAATLVAVGAMLLRNTQTLPSWVVTGALNEPRSDGAVVVMLGDGRVLALGGGYRASAASATAELFDPATNAWTVLPPMHSGRSRPTATLLQNGMVLVAGGSDAVQPQSSAELFDPATLTWTMTGPMVEPRSQHAAVLLPTGEVLVAGGTGGTTPPLIAETYDPATRSWTATGVMTVWRASPGIALLADGRVLVTGGFGLGIGLRSAEIFQPGTRTWFATGDMHQDRNDDHTATLLADGRVLVAGSAGSTAEIYDPGSGAWTVAPAMGTSEGGHAAVRLASGRVLVAGGIRAGLPLATVQAFDPTRGAWAPLPNLVQARIAPLAVLLRDGSVLLVGGVLADETVLSTAEIYRDGG